MTRQACSTPSWRANRAGLPPRGSPSSRWEARPRGPKTRPQAPARSAGGPARPRPGAPAGEQTLDPPSSARRETRTLVAGSAPGRARL